MIEDAVDDRFEELEKQAETLQTRLADKTLRTSEQQTEIDRLRTQLAGCLTAAEGATKDPVKQGDYGWSKAYQAVLELCKERDDWQKGYNNLCEMR